MAYINEVTGECVWRVSMKRERRGRATNPICMYNVYMAARLRHHLFFLTSLVIALFLLQFGAAIAHKTVAKDILPRDLG